MRPNAPAQRPAHARQGAETIPSVHTPDASASSAISAEAALDPRKWPLRPFQERPNSTLISGGFDDK